MTPAALLALIATYRYLVLVPAALLAGLPVCMVSGVAIRIGLLSFWIAYPLLMLGEIIGDVAWYWIGYLWGERFARRFGKYVGINEASVAKAEELFLTYNQRILISSKLTTGFGLAIPILFTAGLSRVSFRDYMSANITGQLFWTGGLIAVGYFFGDLYLRVNTVFEKITTISLFIIVVLVFFGFTRYLRSRIT